jgi:hypothetical protein
MLNINKWITFIQQNQFFEIMEDIIRNDESAKPKSNTPQPQVRKPATGSTSPARSGTDPAPSKTPAASKPTVERKTIPPKPAATKVTDSKTAAKPPAKPAKTVIKEPEKAPVVSTPVAEKESKKLAKAFKKLKIQKKEIASLEKNRDRLMKDLISAIEKKKKNKKIRSLARDLNRIDKRVNNRTASYMQANKKLTNKMKKGKS